MDGGGKSTRCEYDSDEDGEGKPRCTLSAEGARRIVYCPCFCWYYGLRPCYNGLGSCYDKLRSCYDELRYDVVPCCTMKLLCICLFAVGFAIGVTIFVVIVAFDSFSHVAITVDDATLTRFSLVNRAGLTALSYNLSLALIMRSPKLIIKTIKHVKSQEATFSFDGQAFDRVRLPDMRFEQGPRKTLVVYHLSSASDMGWVALGNAGMAEFMKQNSTGVFEVEMALKSRVSYTLRVKKCNLEASCPLKLQLVPPGTPPVMFEKVKCNLAHQKQKFC